MRLPFGLEVNINRQKAHVGPTDLSPLRSDGLWFPVTEAFTGAWQRGVVDQSNKNIFQFSPLFRCVTLIAGDVAKLGVRLVELNDGIWQETTSASFSPVLRKPNRYQTWIQFVESWMLSKLLHGNTYVLKVRDNRQVVVALYILDPRLVKTLVAPGAAVFYELQADNLSTIGETVTIPASEVIHDRMNTLYHPLVGLSPVAAASLSGALGVEMQRQSATFFKNGARPSGFLTAPGAIGKETAERLKTQWETKYSGENVGRVAVLGDNLKFESIAMKAVDAQLVESLRISGEFVCLAFGIPLFKIGLGQLPGNANVSTLNQIYYSDCLQKYIEDLEWSLDDGLSLPSDYGVELLIKNLIRMDQEAQMRVLREGVEGAIVKTNEARRELSLAPTEGGDEVWRQQQYYSLRALARRDQEGTPPPSLTDQGGNDEPPAPANDDETLQPEEIERSAYVQGTALLKIMGKPGRAKMALRGAN